MLSKTRQMVDHLRTSRVEKRESWYIFTTVFLKTIEYPMDTPDLQKRNEKISCTTSFNLFTTVKYFTKNPKNYGLYY